MGTERDWRKYLAQEKRDREERARREADAREQANVATAGDMGLKDKFARAQLAQQNMTRAPKRGGVAISPRSFSAPVDGSAPEGRPASSFREATVPQTASVTGLWGAPRRVSQFQGEVTGLAKGSLLDRWGAGGLYSAATARRTPGASAAPDKADPSADIADYGPERERIGTPVKAGPATPVVASNGENPDAFLPEYGPAWGDLGTSAKTNPVADTKADVEAPFFPFGGAPVAGLAATDKMVSSLAREYTTYGSWSPEDQLEATNALARIRGEFYG